MNKTLAKGIFCVTLALPSGVAFLVASPAKALTMNPSCATILPAPTGQFARNDCQYTLSVKCVGAASAVQVAVGRNKLCSNGVESTWLP